MSKRIITISREFGSGGRSIGKEVAKQLGIAYYDKDLVKKVAVETGFNEQYIEEKGEYAPVKNWLSFVFSGAMSEMSAQDFLWAIQYKVIMELAEKEPCVIVGRCADYILRDRTDCLNVFIHADMAARAERIVRLYGQSEVEPEKRLEDKDKRRKIYYKHYTEQDWGMAQNYDICLNSAAIGIDKCVSVIVDLARSDQAQKEK